MTKKTSISGLRHSPPDDEDDPMPKETCRNSSLHYQIQESPPSTTLTTSHIPSYVSQHHAKSLVGSSSYPEITENLSSQIFHQTSAPSNPAGSGCPQEYLSHSQERIYSAPSIPAAGTSTFYEDAKEPLVHSLSGPICPVFHETFDVQESQNSAAQAYSSVQKYGNVRATPTLDARTMYENLVLGYFMPSALQLHGEHPGISTPNRCPAVPSSRVENKIIYQSNEVTHSIPTMQLENLPSPPNSTNSPLGDILPHLSTLQQKELMEHNIRPPTECPKSNHESNFKFHFNPQVNLDIKPSSCPFPHKDTLPNVDELEKYLAEGIQRDKSNYSSFGTGKQTPSDPTFTCSSVVGHDDQPYNSQYFLFSSRECNNRNSSNISNKCQQESNSASSLERFSVLPPVTNNIPMAVSEGDNISLMSCNSIANVQGNPCSSVSRHTAADAQSSMSAVSPRCSGRSSYSGQMSRNKRALSNSPLSADGLDLNFIIRMSPTSLVSYLNGSRSSSSCVSPGSAGAGGCYGHLSARNSSSSPRSGSDSSGTKRNVSQKSRTLIPVHQRYLLNNNNSSGTTTTNTVSSLQKTSEEGFDTSELENNLLLLQAMQELESGFDVDSNLGPTNHNTFIPQLSNLQVLPQNVASYQTEAYSPLFVSSNPPQTTQECVQQQECLMLPTKALPPLPQRPPPSYDQHMARKAMLQKKNSSDSSQPSNSNSSSFESSEGGTGGSSGTDSDPKRMYECLWLDCKSVFQDPKEFVNHVEKQHVDQRKTEDFVCLWKNCSRNLEPFNARYKLLMHTRVHSGDKPNKCTYTGCKKEFSRLENLKIHMRSHTGERPYPCTNEGCTKTFSNSSDRSKHQKTHQDTRPYVCQVPGCGKKYTDPSSLRKHAKGVHPPKKEPERKKIRGLGGDEIDPKSLSDCLVVHGIQPIVRCDLSPSEPLDQGLSQTAWGAYQGSSDHYAAGFLTSGDTSRSGTTTVGSSTHTSPSSHHSSPRTFCEGSEIELTRQPNSRLGVPSLPPIAVAKPVRMNQCVQQQTPHLSNCRPSMTSSFRKYLETSTFIQSGKI